MVEFPMKISEIQIEKFKSRSATIGLIGLGYAGLPLGFTFAEAGFETVGFDIDRTKVEKLARGENYIGHLSTERLQALLSNGRFRPTADFSELARCDAAIICVPTPLGEGRTPDLSAVSNTARTVGEYLHRGELVVLESTTYPGTTDELVLNILTESGLKVGEDFFLAFSPEREDPANSSFTTSTIPKVVGGVTSECLGVALAAYGQVIEQTVPVSSARVAESTKLLENIYRCVNVAMINELKLLFERMGIDVWEVIRAASTKPFGFTPFYPGPGLGGHCIPVDPFYLSWKAREYDFPARFIELAGEINSTMPNHVVQRVTEGLNLRGKPLRDSRILVVGVAYKRDVEDVRESPALTIIRLLEQRLAWVTYHDPFVPLLRSRHLLRTMESVVLSSAQVGECDAAVIVTDHSSLDYQMLLDNAPLIVDTRNATREYRRPHHNVILA
jgi:UDP-N-acetyl-D-glucosamine dehydrogenase